MRFKFVFARFGPSASVCFPTLKYGFTWKKAVLMNRVHVIALNRPFMQSDKSVLFALPQKAKAS